MSTVGLTGDWVQIHTVLLPAGARAPQVPPDTQDVPLEMWAKGFLVSGPASLDDMVEIETPAGRVLSGRLVAVNPDHTHGFGKPVPELLTIGNECRRIIAQARMRGERR